MKGAGVRVSFIGLGVRSVHSVHSVMMFLGAKMSTIRSRKFENFEIPKPRGGGKRVGEKFGGKGGWTRALACRRRRR